MKFITISNDGTYFLNGDKDGTNPKETMREQGNIVVVGSAASVTIGYADVNGVFQPYSDGLMTSLDTNVVHGYGTLLMVNVVGIASTVNIGYSG